jgi:hypothetical protein
MASKEMVSHAKVLPTKKKISPYACLQLPPLARNILKWSK